MIQSLEESRAKAPNRVLALIDGCKLRLARAVEELRARAALRTELGHLEATGELSRVLSDLGIDRGEVSTLVRNHPGAPRRLAAMLHQLRIEVVPAAQDSADIRAIQRTCLLCATSGHCDHWLRSKVSEDPRHFCPNAVAFVDLVAAGKATHQHDV